MWYKNYIFVSMITEIRLKNFYSFKDCAIPLNGDVNVLVGINGSGKSNLLKAITLLKEGVAGVGLRKHVIDTLGGFDNIYFKGDNSEKDNRIELTFEFDKQILSKYGEAFQENISYIITLIRIAGINNYYVYERVLFDNKIELLNFENGQGTFQVKTGNGHSRQIVPSRVAESTELALSKIFDIDRFSELTVLRKAISEIVIYPYFDTTPGSTIRKPMLPTSEKRLLPDGSNLPQTLNTIKISHKKSFQKIIEKLSEVNPQFKGIDFNFIGGNIELMLEESKFNSSVHVSNISDGTLRYLCLLSVLYNPDRGTFICIDEPETGLHPDMISNISRAIFDASNTSSLIIPTHSDKLLNHFEIEHVRVFERDDENASIVSTYTKKEFEGWYEDFSLGNMWRAGDIGGNRY